MKEGAWEDAFSDAVTRKNHTLLLGGRVESLDWRHSSRNSRGNSRQFPSLPQHAATAIKIRPSAGSLVDAVIGDTTCRACVARRLQSMRDRRQILARDLIK